MNDLREGFARVGVLNWLLALAVAVTSVGAGCGSDSDDGSPGPAHFELLQSGRGTFVPRDISRDGRTVVGGIEGADLGSLWRHGSGFVFLERLVSDASTGAAALSVTGHVVVGTSGDRAFRWRQVGGMVALPTIGGAPSSAWDVTPNGAAIVGSVASEAAIWANARAPRMLGILTGGTQSVATSVSDDGRTVAGHSSTGDGVQAFRWSASTGMVGLGDVAGGSGQNVAWSISGDGRKICGRTLLRRQNVASGIEYTCAVPTSPFCWTESTGMTLLAEVPFSPTPNPDNCRTDSVYWGPMDVSYDGSTVVGYVGDGGLGDVAVIWDTAGPHPISEQLAEAGIDLNGWRLLNAFAVSADGRKVAGTAVGPDGQIDGWVAWMP